MKYEDIFNDIHNITIEELNGVINESNFDVPQWVLNADSKTVYAYALQVIKQLHKKNLESTKLNIIILEKLCDISKNIMNLLTAKNHMYVTRVIDQVNNLIQLTMGKHHEAHLAGPKDMNQFINFAPKDKLVLTLLEEIEFRNNRTSFHGGEDDTDPYYNKS